MEHANTHDRPTAFLPAAFLLTFGLFAQTTPAQTAVNDVPALATAEQAPTDTRAILRSAKTIFVRSASVLVGEAVIESKLRKRSEFRQLGLMITRDEAAADLILEVKHDVFTKYVYTAIDPRTSIVVASGKLSSLGGTVAGKVAKRFMKEVLRAHSQPGP